MYKALRPERIAHGPTEIQHISLRCVTISNLYYIQDYRIIRKVKNNQDLYMTINTINLLKRDWSKLRVKITARLRKKIFLHLKNKCSNTGKYPFEVNSFNFKSLLLFSQRVNIRQDEIFSNITDVKTRNRAAWCNFPSKILINEEFIEGIGYYVGDGRIKIDNGLSTINTNIETIKFFLRWIRKYFNAETKNIRINIFLPRSDFNVNYEKRKWAKLLKTDVNSIKKKYKFKNYHKTNIEVNYSRTIAKLVLDKLIPIIKEKCLTDKSSATAYIRGIMAAEGSPKHNAKSHHRSVHLKMKNKAEVKYVFKLLQFIGLTPSFLFSKQDNSWLVMISGYDELKKLDEMDIFKFNNERREKLKQILNNYHHKQAKKGQVKKFYLAKLLEFERKYKKRCTANELSKYLKRDKSRVITVLRKLQKNKLLVGERIIKTGRPFRFTLTKKGRKFILKYPLSVSQLY